MSSETGRTSPVLATPAFDPVAWWSRADAARTAVIVASTGERVSYGTLDLLAHRWAATLAAYGIGAGDRVAILAQNRLDFLPLYYGCMRRGAVLVPLNWRLAAPELARVLADAAPALLIGIDATRALAEVALASLPPEVAAAARWFDLDRDLLVEAAGAHGAASIDGESPSMLLYTSGSTGTPKGVIIPHRQVLWNAIATTTAWQLGSDDVGPASTPFFHTGGWHVFTTPLLFRGGAVVLVEGFDASDHLGMLDRFGVTVTFGVPTQLSMLREAPDWGRPLPRLRWFIAGGAPCAQRIKDDVRAAGYAMREGYGLTECGPNCFATNATTTLEKPGSVGWPVPMLEMRLRDGDGRVVTAGETGELELRGPQLFGGYYRAPGRTSEVMTPDGWLRTGDLASIDDDGVYFIRGRRKEMFISGGENVFPGEVEAALMDCTGVVEAIVVGIPDPRWGEVGCALVVRRHAGIEDTTLLTELRARIAAYKVPKRVVFVEQIPRLGSGKIDRHAALLHAGLMPITERHVAEASGRHSP